VFPFFFDPTYVLLIPAIILAVWAQWKVRSTFAEYSQVPSRYTGAQVARTILNQKGLTQVDVGAVPGQLTDHYDPSSNQVNLSESIYATRSVASVAVAAHECGHALQHADGYQPMIWRAKLVPAANIGSTMAFPLFFIGLLFGRGTGILLMDLGIGLFLAALLFHLVTLPVEFNASRRALVILEGSGTLAAEEMVGARKVLRAAAWTYVASATMALMNLLRLILLRNMMDRR